MMIHLIGTATALLHPPYRTPISAAQQTIAQRNDLPLGLVIPANRAAVSIREANNRDGTANVASEGQGSLMLIASQPASQRHLPCSLNRCIFSWELWVLAKRTRWWALRLCGFDLAKTQSRRASTAPYLEFSIWLKRRASHGSVHKCSSMPFLHGLDHHTYIL
jgi:hypothetical protein